MINFTALARTEIRSWEKIDIMIRLEEHGTVLCQLVKSKFSHELTVGGLKPNERQMPRALSSLSGWPTQSSQAVIAQGSGTRIYKAQRKRVEEVCSLDAQAACRKPMDVSNVVGPLNSLTKVVFLRYISRRTSKSLETALKNGRPGPERL